MPKLYLLARIADELVALESDHVESVVHVDDVLRVPQSDPSVAGIFALRSRVLTLIDSQFPVTGKQAPEQSRALAIIVEICGHTYGLWVDAVEDVVSLELGKSEKNILAAGAWQKLVREFTVHDGRTIMIIEPMSFVGSDISVAA
ncbi:MAG: chemotaxis protein CheW [Sphingorhabdus sp.]